MMKKEIFRLNNVFSRKDFPLSIHPLTYLGIALLSQSGMSFVQQGLVVAGTFFALAYHLTLTQLGLITSSLSLGIMCSYAMVGAMVDRYGPRRVLAIGSLFMAIFSLSLVVVKSYPLLLSVLFMLGFSLAIAPSAGTKAIFTAFAGRPRGLVMGIRQTGVPIGAALSGWLLPIWVPGLGLHTTYLVFSAELLVTGWLFVLVMPPHQRGSANHLRASILRHHWRKLLQPILVSFLMVAGQYILLTYTIVELHSVHHVNLEWSGMILAFSQIIGGSARIFLGQVSDAIGGRRPPVVMVTAFIGAMTAILIAFLPQGVPLWSYFVLWGMLGVGAVGWNALVLTWAGECVPSSQSGFAMSLNGSIVFLGSAVFAPLFGFVVDSTHHFANGWLMLACIFLCALLVSWRAMMQQKKEVTG